MSKKNIISILCLLSTILLYHLFNDILVIVISFGLFLIYISLFSSIKKDNKGDFLFITIIFLILGIISYYIGNIFNIKYLCFTNITMTLFCYLRVIGKDRNINNIFHILNIIITLLVIIIFKKIYLIYLVFSINYILLYILIFGKIKIYNNIKNVKKIFKINYNIIDNKNIIISNVIKSSYIYFSIIILYYILINKYNYSYEITSVYLSKLFYYGIITYFIFNFLNCIKDIKYKISLCLLLMVISTPISYLLFQESSNILFNYLLLLIFYILYNNIEIKKNTYIIFIIGFIIKVLFEIPLINASYRMGYDLYFGSILSSICGLFVCIIINYIVSISKYKISFTNSFNKILNIIYENIIYILILVLFTLIIKVEVNTIISSILVILFYIFISFIYYIIRHKIIGKRVQ